ncbi:hypothetical protein TNCV_1691791 [Trichonephila clavipes]|nr:hypothetical protein TNCV_1691791 [Trichonephila clavipes]
MLPACIPYRCPGTAPSEIVWAAIGYSTRTRLVSFVGNLNIQCYTSQILRLVAVPYFRDLGDVIFQQDALKSHVVILVLTYFNTKGVRLLP